MRPDQLADLAATIDEDLRRLDLGIRQLKIQYDMYFAGALKRPPFQLQSKVKKLIKRYIEDALPKYHQRFLYNSLVTRYNIMSELWTKRLRVAEEGARGEPAVPERPKDCLITICVLRDEEHAEGPLRELYQSFVEARRTAGSPLDIGYDRFVRGITSQASRLRSKTGCERVEVRLTLEAGQVALRARALPHRGAVPA